MGAIQQTVNRASLAALLSVGATAAIMSVFGTSSTAEDEPPATTEMPVFTRCGELARLSTGELATVTLPLRPPPPLVDDIGFDGDPSASMVPDQDVPAVLGPPNLEYYAQPVTVEGMRSC